MANRKQEDLGAGSGAAAWINAYAAEREQDDLAARLAAPRATDDYPPGAPCPRDCGANLRASREQYEQAHCVVCGFVSVIPVIESVVAPHLVAQHGNSIGRRAANSSSGIAARRREVRSLRGQGLSYRDIAEELGVSPRTIRMDAIRLGLIDAYQPALDAAD